MTLLHGDHMKPNKPAFLREGFWYSDYEPRLPMPVGADKPWTGLAWFATCLRRIEAIARQEAYKGSSTCRICGKRNGSTEFIYGGWRWPVGYRHYIEDHNVRPSLAFQEFILGHQVRSRGPDHGMRVIQRNAMREILEQEDNLWLASFGKGTNHVD